MNSIQGAHLRPFITAGALQHASAYLRTHGERAPKEAATPAIICRTSSALPHGSTWKSIRHMLLKRLEKHLPNGDERFDWHYCSTRDAFVILRVGLLDEKTLVDFEREISHARRRVGNDPPVSVLLKVVRGGFEA